MAEDGKVNQPDLTLLYTGSRYDGIGLSFPHIAELKQCRQIRGSAKPEGGST